MKLFLKRRRHRREEGVNLTPLVDVMFHLMIFILVTAHYSNVYSMKVDLPKAETSQELGEKKIALIALNDDGKIYYQNDEIDKKGLEEKLAALFKEDEASPIIIQADQKSQTGRLVEVMDLIQKVGLKKISLQTDK
jgi:biopolymer transport protein ExbD